MLSRTIGDSGKISFEESLEAYNNMHIETAEEISNIYKNKLDLQKLEMSGVPIWDIGAVLNSLLDRIMKGSSYELNIQSIENQIVVQSYGLLYSLNECLTLIKI